MGANPLLSLRYNTYVSGNDAARLGAAWTGMVRSGAVGYGKVRQARKGKSMGEDREPTFKAEKYRWLKQRVRLDLLYIDEDIQELPILLQEAGENTAVALERRESTKADLETQEAVTANRLRRDEYNGKKSEAAIASMIPLDEDYQRIQKDLSEARLDASLWMNLMDTLRSKSSLVRASADLVQAGFISTVHYTEKRKRDLRTPS